MFTKIAEKLANNLEENQIIKHDDRELYVYGFEQGLSIVLNIITTLLIGLIFNTFFQIVIFMVSYIPLRSFAGGYHAKTPVRCYMFSIIMILMFSLVMKYVRFTIFICSIMIVVSSAVILCLTPVEDKNKSLDKEEQSVYRKRTYLIWAIEFAVTIIFCCLQQIAPVGCLAMTFLVMAVILILGKLKNILF